MLDLVAQSPGLRMALLVLLFAVVAAAAYFITQGIEERQATRSRLLEGATSGHSTQALSSLRNERVENSWVKLVNSIEQRFLLARCIIKAPWDIGQHLAHYSDQQNGRLIMRASFRLD